MEAFNIEKAKQFLTNREEEKQKELSGLFYQAQEDFQRIVDFLIAKYNPTKIFGWGSLLEPQKFTKMSDIDIAVEGLSGPLEGLHAQGDAEELTMFPVDLVELERIHPLHAETIRERGKLFYERR